MKASGVCCSQLALYRHVRMGKKGRAGAIEALCTRIYTCTYRTIQAALLSLLSRQAPSLVSDYQFCTTKRFCILHTVRQLLYNQAIRNLYIPYVSKEDKTANSISPSPHFASKLALFGYKPVFNPKLASRRKKQIATKKPSIFYAKSIAPKNGQEQFYSQYKSR